MDDRDVLGSMFRELHEELFRGFFGSDLFQGLHDQFRLLGAPFPVEIQVVDDVSVPVSGGEEGATPRQRLLMGQPTLPSRPHTTQATTPRQQVLAPENEQLALTNKAYAYMDDDRPSPWRNMWGNMLGDDENDTGPRPSSSSSVSTRASTSLVNGAEVATNTVRYSDGRTEETTRRRLGDREITVTRTVGADGATSTDEKFVNVDPSDRATFDAEWAQRRAGSVSPEQRRGWLDWLMGRGK